MSFWDRVKLNAIDVKIRRAKTLANTASNNDFNVAHPDWIRDAQNKNYVTLTKKIKEDIVKQHTKAIDRRKKFATY